MNKLIPIVVISFLLTGCVEIVEEIQIRKDKSGMLTYRLESSQLGLILNKLSGLVDFAFEEQIQDKIREVAYKLQQKEGIEHVEFTADTDLFDYSISCHFSNTKYLNAALYEVFGYRKTLFSPSYIKASGHTVKKINFAPLLKDFLDDEGIVIPSAYLAEIIYYRSTVKLPGTVKKVKGKNMKVSEDKSQVNQRFRFTDILENKVDVGFKIRY
jgi:hypothetical protein